MVGGPGRGAGLGLLILALHSHCGGGETPLNSHISHYEGLNYSTVATDHHIHKRSVDRAGDEVNLSFSAHGRSFQLRLRADHSVFHPEYLATGPKGVPLGHLDHMHYEGRLEDEPASHVYGSLRDGVFDGTIHTRKDGTFYVERAARYRDELGRNSSHHSVIYHDRHVNFDPNWQVGAATPGCGASPSVQSWMSAVQAGEQLEAQAGEELVPGPEEEKEEGEEEEGTADPRLDPSPEYKYTERAQRSKRAANPPNNRKSCSLFIQTDPLLWRHVYKQENENEKKTQEEILSMIAQHVKAVNRIYGDSEFAQGKYRHTGHTFNVNRIKILNDSDCNHSDSKDKAPFCLANIDVSNFLNLHSKTNHESFCLAYVLTYRDFTGGTLGLAWVASASGASGGICEKYKTYTENVNGIHHTAQRSLNTGIITFVNYNSRVPPKVSQLTLAHEIGHNFGSPHDYPEQCRPGGARGNFIMFASATSGDRENNNKFSPCSLQNISAVLDAVVDERKNNCFEQSDGSFCGNKIVEEGEECDCGFDEEECAEQCCHPRNSAHSGKRNDRSCKLKPSAKCSPSVGPCCTDQCEFISSNHRQMCREEQDCTERSYCNGRQAKCPPADTKEDNRTECNGGTQVCQRGDCKGSICLKYGMEQCFLSSADHPRPSTRDLCKLACQEPGRNSTCLSTEQWVDKHPDQSLRRNLTEALNLRAGAPCDNFQGYCDVFLKCRQVDAEGPLVRLKNLLLNQDTLLTIAQWVTTYWYGVLLMGIGFVITMALFIKCFAAHTPSSNPKLPKNKHIGETLRRPMHTLRRKRYQQAPGGSTASSAAPPSRGAPPPYPGAPAGGPGHGYGEGRGHYNRSRGGGEAAGGARGGGQGGPGGGDRRSWAPQQGPQRHSRIEMSPMSR